MFETGVRSLDIAGKMRSGDPSSSSVHHHQVPPHLVPGGGGGQQQVFVNVAFDFDYLGEDGKKVFMREGEVLLLISKTNKDWWQVSCAVSAPRRAFSAIHSRVQASLHKTHASCKVFFVSTVILLSKVVSHSLSSSCL